MCACIPCQQIHDCRTAQAVISTNGQERTAHVLRTLSPREEKIIRMRFGIEDGSEHTLEEVGRAFSVIRERIRQIEAKALRNCAIPRAAKSSNRSSMTCANKREWAGPGSALLSYADGLISEHLAKGKLELFSAELSILGLRMRPGDVGWLLQDLFQL